MVNQYCPLIYRNTNESLSAIVKGVNPQKEDFILAVGGSGDQAFALLESGAHVDVVDTNPNQIRYIQERIHSLLNGNYSSFLGFYFSSGINKNFFNEKGRLKKIRENISLLNILGEIDIFNCNISFEKWNKFYLSNIFLWDRGEVQRPLDVLNDFFTKVSPNSLVYLSHFPEEIGENTEFKIEEKITNEARKLEETPRLIVLRKVI